MTVDMTPCKWCGGEPVEFHGGWYDLNCSCADNHESQTRIFRLDCSRHMLTADRNKVPQVLMREIESFVEDPRYGCWVRGPVGTGKTMAMALLGQMFIDKWRREVRYINVVKMFNEIRNDLDASIGYLNSLMWTSLLIIDDIGKEKMTDHKREVIYHIIDTRYGAEKPLWLSTNITGQELAEKCGDATADRIIAMCKPIILKGNSMRRPPE